jgi:hypothetical protein
MRRSVLIGSVVLTALVLSAPAALADRPTHVLKQTFSGSLSFPAGTACDFNYQVDFTVVDTGVIFGDPDNPDRVEIHETEFNTHMNLDTGYTLTEVDQLVFHFDASDATERDVGVVWHLRDPDGRIVVVQAGLELFNTDTGELLRVTPNLNPDAAAVICPALGGHPAI